MVYYTKEISYPVNNTKDSHFTIAVDIGGTLAKVIYLSSFSHTLKFKTIETEHIEQFIQLIHKIIRKHNNNNNNKDNCYSNSILIATGGGAFKFKSLLDNEFGSLGVPIIQLDEMKCLINGLDYFIHEINGEVFTYNEHDGELPIDISNDDKNNNCGGNRAYPYMLVNIGSGVSILKVTGPNNFERVGGSSLGGGTLWGLLSLITGAKSYDQMLQWAQEGDNTNVDMLVGDIYGTDYGKIGLKASSIASSFGKVFQGERNENNLQTNESESSQSSSRSSSIHTTSPNVPEEQETNYNNVFLPEFNNKDISKSLLYAVSNNIGQIAYLQAKIHNVERIYFGGSYIRGHLTTMNTLSYAINFWSDGTKKAFFLRHEGYLGSMGAFLHDKNQIQNSKLAQ